MSRNHLTGLLALAFSALLSAGAALWLGTRPVIPLPAPGPMQPELEAALAQLDLAQSGEARALPELRARLHALAELQDRAGEPLRVEALLQGLAGRIEGTLATLDGPRATSPNALLPLAALGVGALGLLALLLSRRRPAQAETAPPAWSEALREEVQAALTLARQAQEEAARAASHAGEQQGKLAHRVRLLAERLDATPAGEAGARLPALLDRMETLGATLGQVASRADTAQERQARGLERLEEAVDHLHQPSSEVTDAATPLAALLPAFETAAAECRATAPLLGELAALAQQAMARATEEAVLRIGGTAERAARISQDALAEAQATLRQTTAQLEAGLHALAKTLPVADLAAQVDRVTAAAAELERAAHGLEGGLPVLELTTQIARMDAAAGAVEQAAAHIPAAELAVQLDRLSAGMAVHLAQLADAVAALGQDARPEVKARPGPGGALPAWMAATSGAADGLNEVEVTLNPPEALAASAPHRADAARPDHAAEPMDEVLGSIQSTIDRLQGMAKTLSAAADAPAGAA